MLINIWFNNNKKGYYLPIEILVFKTIIICKLRENINYIIIIIMDFGSDNNK